MENSIFETINKIMTLLPGLLVAMTFHEAGHAYMAMKYGDNTAKMMGRLTLNPVAHIDLFGTIIFPLLGFVMGGFLFGWAKPVPVNFRNLSDYRKGMFWVAFAGPLTNFALAIISSFFYVFLIRAVGPEFIFYKELTSILEYMILINMVLGIFNLIPLPPMDGSRMISSYLSFENEMKYQSLERYSMIILIVLLMSGIFRYIVFMPSIIVMRMLITSWDSFFSLFI